MDAVPWEHLLHQGLLPILHQMHTIKPRSASSQAWCQPPELREASSPPWPLLPGPAEDSSANPTNPKGTSAIPGRAAVEHSSCQ